MMTGLYLKQYSSASCTIFLGIRRRKSRKTYEFKAFTPLMVNHPSWIFSPSDTFRLFPKIATEEHPNAR